ncbi:MAG: hypothetical protein Q8O67_30180 [Deltaproteobacteria bacterium]|nr:hypothetical protein [Deltaproteobacteria bacterium]
MSFPRGHELVRRVITGTVFVVGVVGSVATTGPTADLSGVSEEETVVLDANTPSAAFTAAASLSAEGATTTGGEIALNIVVEGADASLAYTLRSETTGEEETADIVDTQAQGSARIGIAAFESCTDSCVDELTIEFERNDASLEGELVVTFSLDALASTEAEATGDIDLTID